MLDELKVKMIPVGSTVIYVGGTGIDIGGTELLKWGEKC